MRTYELGKLSDLLKADLRSKEAVLRHVLAKIGTLEAKIVKLRKEKRNREKEVFQNNTADAALRTGVDSRWLTWCDIRIVEWNRQIAELLVEKEKCLVETREAFGRSEVAASLSQAAKATKKNNVGKSN